MEKSRSKQNGASSESNSASELNDDLILVERIIPVIDLSTPSMASRASPPSRISSNQNCRALRQLNASTNVLPDKTAVNNVSIKQEKNVLCAICMICKESSIGRKPYATVCGHVFCGNCIRRYLVNQKQCPTCRKFITSLNIFPLYI